MEGLPKEDCRKCLKKKVRHLTSLRKEYVDEEGAPWRGRQCPSCRKEYERDKSNRAYRRKMRETKKDIYDWKCDFCEKDFTTTYRGDNNSRIRHCSSSCQNKMLKLRKSGLKKGQGKCGQCGNIYEKPKDNTLTCSECKQKRIDRKLKEKEVRQSIAEEKRREREIRQNEKQKKRLARLELQRINRLAKLNVKKKMCLMCGDVEVAKGKSKYCSKRCSNRKSKQNPNTRAARKNAKVLRKRAFKQRSLVGAFSKELRDIYKNCPEGMVVDHIIPLNHPNVSGLHIPWNLQYLSTEENSKKSNKLDF